MEIGVASSGHYGGENNESRYGEVDRSTIRTGAGTGSNYIIVWIIEMLGIVKMYMQGIIVLIIYH